VAERGRGRRLRRLGDGRDGRAQRLVNNAGILRDGLLVKKDKKTGEIKKLSRADWNAVIDVNLTGATLMAREVAAAMMRARRAPA
jgi:3-oxoacyl-[acyl-carrier protein] reductase